MLNFCVIGVIRSSYEKAVERVIAVETGRE